MSEEDKEKKKKPLETKPGGKEKGTIEIKLGEDRKTRNARKNTGKRRKGQSNK